MDERDENPMGALPDKARYCVAEIVGPLADVLDCSTAAARMRIYRAICDGRLIAKSHLGCMRIPHAEVERILNGEIWNEHATIK